MKGRWKDGQPEGLGSDLSEIESCEVVIPGSV